MNSERLALRIITPDGQSLTEAQIDVVVFRRKEHRFESGSEIAVFPRHAPLLIRIPVAPVRYRQGDTTTHVAVGGGFAEVKENEVVVVTPRFAKIPAHDPHPSRAALRLTRQWRNELKDFRREMVGYL